MIDSVDYIKYHGYISEIRDNVDDNYIWFDIGQKEQYKDKNGVDRTNLSFFSARIYKEYMYKINLEVGKDIYVKGIPKGYIDKKGYRQNYIHVLEINGIDINKEPTLNEDGYWNGIRIPTEKEPMSKEEQEEIDKLIKECIGDD